MRTPPRSHERKSSSTLPRHRLFQKWSDAPVVVGFAAACSLFYPIYYGAADYSSLRFEYQQMYRYYYQHNDPYLVLFLSYPVASCFLVEFSGGRRRILEWMLLLLAF